MYDIGSGKRLYMPAMVRHLPSTYSIAKMSPAYVTDTDTRPSSALNVIYNSKDWAKNSARPVSKKRNKTWFEIRQFLYY